MLTLYRRHNPKKCSSTDSQHCEDRRHPCPIWARGSTESGAYVRQPLKTRDWAKALDRARDLEATGKVPKPTPESAKRITLEMLRDQVLENKKAENLAPGTLKKYRAIFEGLLPFAKNKGIRYVDELDLSTLQEFRNSWKVQSLTRSIKQGTLQTIMDFALRHKWIPENPAEQLGKIRVYRAQKLPFTDEDMQGILKAAKSKPNVYTFILTMRYSGLRISDVAMLKLTSLERTNHLVLRTTKTGTPVKVLLPDVVANSLRAIKRASRDYFFWNGRSSPKSNTDYWRQRRLASVFKDAGIDRAHSHRFRHTFAVNLLNKGISEGIIATLLGNSEKVVRQYYSAFVKSRQQGLDAAVVTANGFREIDPAVADD